MSDQSKPLPQIIVPDQQQPFRPTVKFLTASILGAAFLLLSGLTLTGTVIALIVATPILVILSPILVPAGIVVFLFTAGLFFSGGCGLMAILALTWMYNYLTGKHPPGADKLEYARGQLARKAHDMKERAKEYGQYVQQKAQEAAHQTHSS